MDDAEEYCICYAGRSGEDGKCSSDLIGGRYVMISMIKSGAMGCVFKAYDTRLGIHVAVKKMLSPLVTPGEVEYSEKRFRDEATILSSLHHAGLPGVIDFFTTRNASSGETAHYLVMSFIEGRDLESLMEERAQKPFPIPEAPEIFRQIADILTYLHEHNPPIVYCDLKLSNIMLQKGADINYVKGLPSGITLLHVAASKADPHIITLLICHRSDVNVKNVLGLTPLHFACSMGSVQGMKMLLEAGAEICAERLLLSTSPT